MHNGLFRYFGRLCAVLLMAVLLTACAADGGWPSIFAYPGDADVAATLIRNHRQALTADPADRQARLVQAEADYARDASAEHALALAMLRLATAEDRETIQRTLTMLQAAFPEPNEHSALADLAVFVESQLHQRQVSLTRMADAEAETKALRLEKEDLVAKIEALRQIEQRLNRN